MGKKICLILGNGFSIDFMNHLSKHQFDSKLDINLSNLFKDGDALKWPLDKRPGFLSYKNCPNLWGIGARSFLTNNQTQEILERVVTCANVFSLKGTESIFEHTGNGFLHAYKELVAYLKYLFVHYDNLVPVLGDSVNDWAWAKFLKQLNDDSNVEEVTIITYNYDIWLEKLLNKIEIGFEMPLFFPNSSHKFKIFKPHGSISYQYKTTLPTESFSINYTSLFLDCPLSDIKISYTDLDRHTPINFIIPPAGESGRASNTWAQAVRNECASKISQYGADDLAIICGISYWHVDRAEIDHLLNKMNSDIEITYLDPSPSYTLDAVLNSLFTKYTHISRSALLEEYPL